MLLTFFFLLPAFLRLSERPAVEDLSVEGFASLARHGSVMLSFSMDVCCVCVCVFSERLTLRCHVKRGVSWQCFVKLFLHLRRTTVLPWRWILRWRGQPCRNELWRVLRSARVRYIHKVPAGFTTGPADVFRAWPVDKCHVRKRVGNPRASPRVYL